MNLVLNTIGASVDNDMICSLIQENDIEATQTIPIGVAYPVWTGIGAVGAVLLGIFVFHEPATFWRVFFLSTLILSIVGLKYVG